MDDRTQWKWLPIKDVKPSPNNRNQHDAESIRILAKLIDFYGWRSPIIISNQSGTIAAGHGRLMAAKRLKHETVPVCYQDFADEDEEIAFRTADNASSHWSKLDFAGINIDLGNMSPSFDKELLAIKGFEIDVADKEKKKIECPACGHIW